MLRRLVVATAILLATPLAGAGEPAPFDLLISVRYLRASGDQGAREDAELQLVTELRRSACFRSVAMRSADDDGSEPDDRLRLDLTILEVFEEISRDVSTAERTGVTADPRAEMMQTAEFRVLVDARLSHPATETELRGKRIKAGATRRPLSLYDDARDLARTEALVEFARETRAFLCKGGAKKLRKELGR